MVFIYKKPKVFTRTNICRYFDASTSWYLNQFEEPLALGKLGCLSKRCEEQTYNKTCSALEDITDLICQIQESKLQHNEQGFSYLFVINFGILICFQVQDKSPMFEHNQRFVYAKPFHSQVNALRNMKFTYLRCSSKNHKNNNQS